LKSTETARVFYRGLVNAQFQQFRLVEEY